MNEEEWPTIPQLYIKGESVPEVFQGFVKARAVYDFQHKDVFNRYPEGCMAHDVYEEKINSLKKLKETE